MPEYYDRRPYLQVDLRSMYRVTGLRVQGSSAYRYARGVIVMYSADGWTWTAYSDDQSGRPRQFDANHSPGIDITHINFANPFTVESLCRCNACGLLATIVVDQFLVKLKRG